MSRPATESAEINKIYTSLELLSKVNCYDDIRRPSALFVHGGSRILKNMCIGGDASIDGDLNIKGNLVVQGVTMANSRIDLVITDKVMCLANVEMSSDITANGAGMIVIGPQPGCSKSIIWYNDIGVDGAWNSNYDFNLGVGRIENSLCGSDNLKTGHAFRIDGVSVLDNTTLGDNIIYSSLEKIGTLKSGTIENSISILSISAPTSDPLITTDVEHGLTSGDKVLISNTDSTPAIDGCHVITVLSPTSFTITSPTSFAGSTGIVQAATFPIDIGTSTLMSGTHTINCSGDFLVNDDDGTTRFLIDGSSGQTTINNTVEKNYALRITSNSPGGYSGSQTSVSVNNTTNNTDLSGISSGIKNTQLYNGTNTVYSNINSTINVVGETIDIAVAPNAMTPRISAKGLDITTTSINNLGSNMGIFAESGGAESMMQSTGVVGIVHANTAISGLRIGVVGCVNHDRDSIASEFNTLIMNGGIVTGGYFCNPTNQPDEFALVTNGLTKMGNVIVTENITVAANVNAGNINTDKISTNDISVNSGDNLTIDSKNIILSGNLLPNTSNVYTIGTQTNKWDNIVTNDIEICGNLVAQNISLGNCLTYKKDTITTTTGISTTLQTINTTTDTMYMLEIRVLALRDNGAEGGAWVYNRAYRNNGGVLSQVGGTDSLVFQDNILWTVVEFISGTNILVNVDGVLGSNITWNACTSIYTLSV